MGGLKDLGVLLAHARELADIEEAPMASGHRIDVEVLGPQLRVGPVAVGVVGGHVVGHHVEHDAHARLACGLGEGGERLLAPEVDRQAPGVDHVIAVCRARAGLVGGRQVEMRDPQIAQVGDEGPRVVKAEVAGQLQPIGGTQARGGGRFMGSP